MDIQGLFDWIGRHGRATRTIAAPLLVLLVGAVFILVYQTGGIKFVYSHSMYIPILLSGIIFGIKGGIFFGLLGGLVLGPFMPIDVISGEQQKAINWLYRTGFFTLIGALSGIASDAARSYMAHLKWLSQNNYATRLPNRRALSERLYELGGDKRLTDPFFLVSVSIENAMELKSAFGFAIVDASIQQLATRLENKQMGRYIFHIDTSQIAILQSKGSQDIENILDELIENCREPVIFNKIPIHIDTRMGNVSIIQPLEAPEVYLQRADVALTVASERSQERIAYSPDMQSYTEENLSVLGELKDSIKGGQLSLHYQPKVAIATGQLHGVEALMRWNHPTRGNIPPGIFIPRAEQSTLIHTVTDLALNQAMGQIVKWQTAGMDTSIAVNISPRNMIQPGFTDSILRLLDRHELSGDMLELEVTEGALMVDIEHTIRELRRLSDAKITISIDDFGTGYSSLQYMHRLPISIIKIDQSFVKRLPADKDAAYIVDAAVSLAHKMGILSLAEGVENRETFDYLGNIGCDIAQGYLISRPLSAEGFSRWHAHFNGIEQPLGVSELD